MDVIEASHLNVIKKYLESNPGASFKANKIPNVHYKPWNMYLIDAEGSILIDVYEQTFGEAAKSMSILISTGETSNGSNSRG